jgi:hypothetical protein
MAGGGKIMRYPEATRIAELERELAEARAEIERKNALIEQMREALIWGCNVCPEVNDYGDRRHCEECKVNELLHKAALSAAERGGK